MLGCRPARIAGGGFHGCTVPWARRLTAPAAAPANIGRRPDPKPQTRQRHGSRGRIPRLQSPPARRQRNFNHPLRRPAETGIRRRLKQRNPRGIASGLLSCPSIRRWRIPVSGLRRPRGSSRRDRKPRLREWQKRRTPSSRSVLARLRSRQRLLACRWRSWEPPGRSGRAGGSSFRRTVRPAPGRVYVWRAPWIRRYAHIRPVGGCRTPEEGSGSRPPAPGIIPRWGGPHRVLRLTRRSLW